MMITEQSRGGSADDAGDAAAMDGGTLPTTVVVLGFMGAGKSAVGRHLAVALRIPFVDTDELISAAAGPIARIFEERGEAGFRALEQTVVTAALAEAAERPCVLSLGGGAVLSDAVREALRGLPHVVWLTAPPDELWGRVTGEGPEIRPLAADETSFRALLASREPLYGEVATEVVDTHGRTPGAIAAELAASILGAARRSGPRSAGGGVR